MFTWILITMWIATFLKTYLFCTVRRKRFQFQLHLSTEDNSHYHIILLDSGFRRNECAWEQARLGRWKSCLCMGCNINLPMSSAKSSPNWKYFLVHAGSPWSLTLFFLKNPLLYCVNFSIRLPSFVRPFSSLRGGVSELRYYLSNWYCRRIIRPSKSFGDCSGRLL